MVTIGKRIIRVIQTSRSFLTDYQDISEYLRSYKVTYAHIIYNIDTLWYIQMIYIMYNCWSCKKKHEMVMIIWTIRMKPLLWNMD